MTPDIVAVRRLLLDAFDELEARWDAAPLDAELALALTIKEFMQVKGVDDVDLGIRWFAAFKDQQARQLDPLRADDAYLHQLSDRLR